jgi:hypothetical protein
VGYFHIANIRLIFCWIIDGQDEESAEDADQAEEELFAYIGYFCCFVDCDDDGVGIGGGDGLEETQFVGETEGY